MKKCFFLFGLAVLMLTGCGTFGLKQIRKSEASLEFAKKIFAKNDYKALMSKMNLPAAGLKNVGPVVLYSTFTERLSVDQAGWNYVQRVTRTDGLECYGALLVIPSGSEGFRTPNAGKFYCFRQDDSFASVEF